MEKKKKKMDREAVVELIIVILLGITALLTAWASWIGSLHGGNQATNYTTSNNLASEGNSEYNAAVQSMTQDMMTWNDISNLQLDLLFAQSNEDEYGVQTAAYKIYFIANDNFSESFAAAVGWDFESYDENDDPTDVVLTWMEKDEALASPFYDEAFCQSYMDSANELLAESTELLEQGKRDNANGDAYGLVTVLYSVVLFLLGICGTMKNVKNKNAVVIISAAVLVISMVYMCTIPMPTGFSLANFFAHG